MEQCYGAIVVYREEKENLFLILQHEDSEGSWSFPKGHHEGQETPKETALRELFEETGISEIDFMNVPLIHEEYTLGRENEEVIKKNDYFVGFVKNKEVKIQEGEIRTYLWATYEEALSTFQYESRKEVLKKALEYLNYESRK